MESTLAGMQQSCDIGPERCTFSRPHAIDIRSAELNDSDPARPSDSRMITVAV